MKSAARSEKAKETAAKRKANKQIGPPGKRLASSGSATLNTTPIPPNLDQHSAAPTTFHPESVPPNVNQQVRATETELIRIENERRRQAYHELEQEDKSNSAHQRMASVTVKRGSLSLGGPIDDLINAGTREGLGCRRDVIKIYFGNDKIGECGSADRIVHLIGSRNSHTCCLDHTDHLRCDNSPDGCQRCAPQSTTGCCDLCSPHLLDIFLSSELPTKARTSKRSYCAPYEMEAKDRTFQRALLDWREEKALEKLGDNDYEEYGVVLFMSDEILQRIIDCFHYRKISTLDGIKKETHWRSDLIETYGPSILTIVQKVDPPATTSTSDISISNTSPSLNTPVSGPSAQPSSSTAQVPTNFGPKPTKVRVCSACKQPGHNSESYCIIGSTQSLILTRIKQGMSRKNCCLVTGCCWSFRCS